MPGGLVLQPCWTVRRHGFRRVSLGEGLWFLRTAAAGTRRPRTLSTFGEGRQQRAHALPMSQLSFSVDLEPRPVTVSLRHACLRISDVTKPSAERGRLTLSEPGLLRKICQVDEEVPVIERLKLYEWTFSATAEAVVGLLLALLLVACMFA